MADVLLTTFRFRVVLRVQDASGRSNNLAEKGGFQECSGLDIDLDVQEYMEGGRNDRVVRRVGRAKYSPIVLKRGMFQSEGALYRTIWTWIQSISRGERPVRRCDGLIEVLGDEGAVTARWEFDRALPMKVAGPRLDARTGEVAIEELHLAHEALRLVE